MGCHPSVQVGKELYEGETEHELTEAVRSPTLILPSPQEPTFYRNGELARIMEGNGVANDMLLVATGKCRETNRYPLSAARLRPQRLPAQPLVRQHSSGIGPLCPTLRANP